MTEKCLACNTDCGGSIGVLESGMLCPACLNREAVVLPRVEVAIDRDFGAGAPGLIAEECYRLRDLLHQKNTAYGNSALDPVRIFSKADTEEQIRVRLDDKLSRLSRGSAAGEDVELDIMGYLILLRVARRLKEGSNAQK